MTKNERQKNRNKKFTLTMNLSHLGFLDVKNFVGSTKTIHLLPDVNLFVTGSLYMKSLRLHVRLVNPLEQSHV